jgi:hypothetical protein
MGTPAGKYYQINPSCFLFWVNDKQEDNLKFHIKADDYFGTLATMVDLMKQEKIKLEEKHNRMLEKITKDLLKLQKEYSLKIKK